MKKFFLVFFLLVFICGISFSQTSYVEKVGMGEINWTKGIIKMRGQGVPPMKTQNIGQARLLAIRAAKADAMRNFLEVVNGVRVTSDTLVQNMVVVSDEIRTRVEGVVSGFVVEEKVHYLSDGSCWVDIVFPLYGRNGLSPIILPQVIEKRVEVPTERIKEVKVKDEECEKMIEQLRGRITELENLVQELKKEIAKLKEEKKEVVVVQPEVKTEPEKKEEGKIQLIEKEQKTTEVTKVPEVTKVSGGYTGLIIDATGLGAKPCMSPRVTSESGEEIYGTINVSPDMAIDEGIVSYAKTVADAKKLSRIGANPYIVKAIDVQGSFKANPVISKGDAEKVKGLKNVLNNCAVAIVL